MRQALAAVAALLVLGAVVAGAYLAIEERGAGTALEAPDATVDAYLDAWARGDHDAMEALVRDAPPTFTEVHEQLRDGLGVEELTVERTDLAEDVDGRATATAVVTADVDVVGEVAWEVTLRVLRERGEWGVAWGPEAVHPDWRPGLLFVTVREPAERAPILARDGTPLAGPGERVTFGFEPGAVDDPDEVVAAFEAAIPGSGVTAERLLGQDLVDGWFYPVASLAAEDAEDVDQQLIGIPGVLRRTDAGARNLLADGFAVHVVGTTGEATAEELERLGPSYERGDHVGKTGLEQVLEPRLAPHEVVRVELRDGPTGPVRSTLATGVVGRQDGDDDVQAGPVTTTLDVAVQRAVENTLVGRRTPAAVVVVDAQDGAVRAAASRPIDGFNRAFEGRYPPGSAIAPLVVEARSAEGGDPNAAVPCPAEAVVAGRHVANPTDAELGQVPLPEAVAAACTTSLATLGAELGGEALTAAAGRFGADVAPLVPLFANGLSFPPPVDLGEAAVAAAGQGRVEASPLHLATVAAATATGTWWPPYLLEDDGPGTSVRLAPGALDGLQQVLAGADVDDEPGLTGVAGAATGQEEAVHSWFLGTLDGLGLAVLVEDDEGEGEAAVLAARFARELAALADEPADEPAEDGPAEAPADGPAEAPADGAEDDDS